MRGDGVDDGELVSASGAVILSRRLPSEDRIAQIAVPSVVLSLLASFASVVAAEALAVIWALLLVGALSLRLLISTTGDELSGAVVAAGYWTLLGLAVCAPLDSLIAFGIAFVLWTSARPGHEWLPWPTIYARVATLTRGPVLWIAAAPLWAVSAAGGAGVALIALVYDSKTALPLFIALVVTTLLLLVLTSAGEPVPATRGLGRIAIVLSTWAWAAAAPWRVVLVGVCVVVGVASWWALDIADRTGPPALRNRIDQ